MAEWQGIASSSRPFICVCISRQPGEGVGGGINLGKNRRGREMVRLLV